jgi:hypothetical protein
MNKRLTKHIAELEKNIQNYHKLKPGISKSNIGWHIEHSLLTIDRVTERLAQTDSRRYKWKPSLIKLIVFASRTIPRGKAKSPDIVRPKAAASTDSLKKHIGETRERLAKLPGIGENQFFEHPYFGHLKRGQAITFLEIHTKHHLKIIREILA